MSLYRYQVTHLTDYKYSGRIDSCHNLARHRPMENASQRIIEHRFEITPKPSYFSERIDYFNNSQLYFEIFKSHSSLKYISHFTVEVDAPDSPAAAFPKLSGIAWDSDFMFLPSTADASGKFLIDYLLPSRACPVSDATDDLLRPLLDPGKDRVQVATDLMSLVYKDFAYVSGVTSISTPVSDILKAKQGVCQDFAHVMISALRRIGIPTRYVSGYLETLPPPGQVKLQGSDATHAWIEFYAGDRDGWIGLDPTNDIATGHQHIKAAHGRDYFDVQPLKGQFIGSGEQEMTVEVDVIRV